MDNLSPARESSTTTSSSTSPMEVLRQFRLIFGSVRQHFREVEDRCGLSGSQMWLLTETRRTPGVGVSELAARLAIHQSTCSLLVEKLVTRGLLTKRRSREDQRRVGLCLTADGETLLAKVPGPAEGILPVALGSLPQAVLDNLNEGLRELIGKLRLSEELYASTPLAEIVSGTEGLGPVRKDESCMGR